MKIAFDLDKTYDAKPALFDAIAKRFQEAGHEVGILTARHQSEGADTNFKPDFIYFLDIGELSYEVRAALKAKAMQVASIDIIFDDRANLFPKDVVAINIL